MSKRGLVVILVFVMLLTMASFPDGAGAAQYSKIAKYIEKSGSGVTTNYSGELNYGRLRAQTIVEHPWYNIMPAHGKVTIGACKIVTPKFSGNALVRTIVILNGELKVESKGLLKIPGGNPNASVSIIVQTNSKIVTKTAGFVSNAVILNKSMTFNNKIYLLEMTYPVTYGVPVEICGGYMTNAAIVLGGGKAVADFYSSRFASSYVEKLELIKK